MSKSADYGISTVKYNVTHTHIDRVSVSQSPCLAAGYRRLPYVRLQRYLWPHFRRNIRGPSQAAKQSSIKQLLVKD